ncbi:hypothetical protein GCM10023201_03090 [Actinomycetospora corticicola]|uniref:Uncharacterized protein n=1 Tax=Actinomycetospora corticicola TaxID=663602 RepID=A0A7Y9E2P8_9PSEU|nr:hypothetical protein [Actinomycetospora corticicola]NYD39856.1 hypothetical protein [Actinomycetospora corticicola]
MQLVAAVAAVGEPRQVRPAVAAAENATHWWRTAVAAQRALRAEALEHADFYDLTAEAVGTLRSIEELAELLARQVGGYGSGRVLRDDAGCDPAARLVRAVADVASLRIAVTSALAEGERFWSSIGHIGLEIDPTSGPEEGRP